MRLRTMRITAVPDVIGTTWNRNFFHGYTEEFRAKRRDIFDMSYGSKHPISCEEIMLPIYKGIPELFEYVIGLVERRPKRDIQSILAFYLLREILDATEHYIIHYFTLTLNESFLQNSHLGNPYQKWAKTTNENFQKVDINLKSLEPIIAHILFSQTDLDSSVDGFKKLMFMFCRLNKEYACCEVNLDKPFLAVSAISFYGWLDTTSGSLIPKPRGHLEFPPTVIKSEIPITDRTVLKKLQRAGHKRVEKLRILLMQFAAWLEANYSMGDITSVSQPTRRTYGI